MAGEGSGATHSRSIKYQVRERWHSDVRVLNNGGGKLLGKSSELRLRQVDSIIETNVAQLGGGVSVNPSCLAGCAFALGAAFPV